MDKLHRKRKSGTGANQPVLKGDNMTDKITITRKDGAYIVTIDGVLFWLGDHALVGGLTLAIGFLLFWFGEECERQMRKERRR